jgi:hypothetical protein
MMLLLLVDPKLRILSDDYNCASADLNCSLADLH